jgi:chromosome segregation protein
MVPLRSGKDIRVRSKGRKTIVLKRLELVGFKSFADKTAFEFAPGITAIVGPNGSGKSNVVDAVRWILGEQSAKSLRGGEMADVIFNGSTSRRSLGLAEVTMTLDNAKRRLAMDMEEVQVTRRVYRSGEGEYLINHQPCRLRDIKDLFLGTGAGSTQYCIIEQGRVDVLLQASTRERRVIFEEAAGISRFKARKIETLRKLERVEQNLQQLRLVLDEVNKQLRSVKLQASKAERYQEYQKRLQELRVALGLQEYHQLTGKLEAATAVLDGLRGELASRRTEAQNWEEGLRRLDEELARFDEAIHEQEGRLGLAREQITAAETTLGHERELAGQLEKDVAGRRAALTELSVRTTALAAAAAEAARECSSVEADSARQRQVVVALEDAAQKTNIRLAVLQRQINADKAEHLERMRQAARHQNEVVGRQSHLEGLQRERDRLRHKGDQAAESLASLDVELQALTQAEDSLTVRLGQARQALTDRGQQRERFRQLIDSTTALAADLRAQQSGLASRIEVLDGLERSHEGLGAGVREVFDHLEQPDPGPWRTVVGMVADLLSVPRDLAPLIDLALGEVAQGFLVRDVHLLEEALNQRSQPLASRVSFVPVGPSSILDPQPSILGAHLGQRAVDVVTCTDPELPHLPAQLLGNTLIVADLAAARAIAREHPGLRCITRHGELLETDGTLTVGVQRGGAGILSRKTELRELREQADEMRQRIAVTEDDLAGLRFHEAALETETAHLQEEIDVLNDQLADLRSRTGQHQERRAGLHLEVETSRSDISRLEQEIADLEEACRQARALVDQAEQQVQAVQARMEQAEREIGDKEQLREQQLAERESARVALAQIDERLKALRAKHGQIDADLSQRRQERAQGERQLAASRLRLEESQQTMLQAQSDLARWYLDKEAAGRQVAELGRQRDLQRRQRQALADRLQAAQTSWRAQQDQAHQRELEVNDLRHQRSGIAERLREDYQIDLAQLYEDSFSRDLQGSESLDLAKANEEIEELKRKIQRLGSVNLEALDELVQLETRARELQTQYDDLVASQKALLEIIDQINQDSRKLFLETFTAVRDHFQELFRKLFGGGMADVVLEDDNDILECGIEIIARPPGKELRSISLLSGGEKTLTAVALLLAIFRSKPSPFCILDEVDAALDEANIGRFSAVLRDFLDLSQFILVTHSKKTMATADVLYGVTMQESGVSKRVAVRLEDWPDEQRNGEAATAEAVPVQENGASPD